MKEINLNNILFLIVLTILGVWGVRQFLEKRDLKKELNNKTEELLETKKTSEDLLTKSEKKMLDSIDYYKETVEYLVSKTNALKRTLKARELVLMDSIYKLSTSASIDFLDSLFTPGGDDVSITENQIKDIHVSEIKLRELELTAGFQQNVIRELDAAYGNCLSSMDVIQEDLDQCISNGEQKDSNIKSLRKKVWGSRIVGVAGIALAVLAVL